MSEPITAIPKAERADHTPGPWVISDFLPQVDALDRDGKVMNPVCQLIWPTSVRSDRETGANAALIAQAPALLAHAEKSLREMIAERDCCFKDWTNPRNGFVHYAGARAVLYGLDRDIEELRALIAAARGEE